MIEIGRRRVKPSKRLPDITLKIERGFYLVIPTGRRFWLGECLDETAINFESACVKYLSSDSGYQYWIDYCLGRDITGALAWSNIDQQDAVMANYEAVSA